MLAEVVRAFPAVTLEIHRGTAGEVSEQLKTGAAELAIAGPLGREWERLEAWQLFEEGYRLVLNKEHPLATQGRITFGDLARQRLLCRPFCEQALDLAAVLRANGVEQHVNDSALSDGDLTTLLEANLGVSIMPESARLTASLGSLVVVGLDLSRSVSLYAVAGRQRSHAATASVRLMRACDWSVRRENAKRDDSPTRTAAMTTPSVH